MSISENVGGVSKYLNNIRTADKYLDMKEGIYNSLMESNLEPIVTSIRRAKSSVKHLVIPGMFFEDMGITYLGPVDGHNISAMMKVLRDGERVLSMATSAPARLLGLDGQTGSIREGLRADLTIWSANPMETWQAKVVRTYLGGEVIYREGDERKCM